MDMSTIHNWLWNKDVRVKLKEKSNLNGSVGGQEDLQVGPSR